MSGENVIGSWFGPGLLPCYGETMSKNETQEQRIIKVLNESMDPMAGVSTMQLRIDKLEKLLREVLKETTHDKTQTSKCRSG